MSAPIKQWGMTAAAVIDPKTGHEAGLPDPRPRPEIWKEMLASYQVDPQISIYDVFYRLQFVARDLEAIVMAELEKSESKSKRKRRQ